MLAMHSGGTVVGRIALAFLLGACAARDEAPQPETPAHPWWEDEGFDAREEETSWRAGDVAVYRVRFEDGDEQRSWRIQVTNMHAPSESPLRAFATYHVTFNGDTRQEVAMLLPVLVEVREEGEQGSTVSVGQLPLQYVERGLYPVCEIFAELASRPAPIGDEQASPELLASLRDAWLTGFATLHAFLLVVQRDERLSDVLFTVVEKPSLLSILWNRSIDLGIDPDFTAARRVPSPVPPPLADLPAYSLPGRLTLNDEPALEIELVACPAKPPLHVAAGLVRFVGRHPERPERRVTIELVGARRGALTAVVPAAEE